MFRRWKSKNHNSYVLFYPGRDIWIIDVPVRVLSVRLACLPVSGVEQALAHRHRGGNLKGNIWVISRPEIWHDSHLACLTIIRGGGVLIIQAFPGRVSLLEMSPLRRLKAAVVEAEEPGGGGGGGSLELVRFRLRELNIAVTGLPRCLLTSQVWALRNTIWSVKLELSCWWLFD